MDLGWYKELNRTQVGLGKVCLLILAAFIVGRFLYFEIHDTFIDTVEAQQFQTKDAVVIDNIGDDIETINTNVGKMTNKVTDYKIDIARNGDEGGILQGEIIRLEARIEEEEERKEVKETLRSCLLTNKTLCNF
jgi:peptidoglycan hydrolase CwlO-like protein